MIKTVLKYYLKKNRYEFSSASSKYGSTFICWRHTWRDLVYKYSWAKSPMISGYEQSFNQSINLFAYCMLDNDIQIQYLKSYHIWFPRWFTHAIHLFITSTTDHKIISYHWTTNQIHGCYWVQMSWGQGQLLLVQQNKVQIWQILNKLIYILNIHINIHDWQNWDRIPRVRPIIWRLDSQTFC